MEKILNMSSLIPFEVGAVQNGERISTNAVCKFHKIRLSYPSRINAMAIDPSRVAVQCGRRFTPGEILFSVKIPLKVSAEVIDSEDKIEFSYRKALVKHGLGIMRWLTGFKEGIRIRVEGTSYPHCGFGSSGRTIAAVCVAINELLGNPIDNDTLQVFIAQNHGEEIEGDESHLIPVQCIGGAASSGLHKGGVQVLTGESRLIASASIQNEYKIVVAWPEKSNFIDSKDAMSSEIANMDMFYDIGKKYGNQIAYRILHELLPAMMRKDWDTVGDVIEWYRYDLGSNQACAFSHPMMNTWANLLRKNKECLDVSICGVSSVGPGIYAISRNPEKSIMFFNNLGLKCITADFYNGIYHIESKD